MYVPGIMAIKDVLIILVKYPEPGRVKTRLAEMLGADEAARLYRDMAEDIIGRLEGCGACETIIFFDPPERASDVREWLGEEFSYMEQSGGDLGQRISNAFESMFKAGAGRVVVIGTDCTEVTREVVTRGFLSLEKEDVVVGPAKDGGYYLLGLSCHLPALFDSIDWSTDRVFGQTVERIKEQGLSFGTLEPLKDLDEPSDLL